MVGKWRSLPSVVAAFRALHVFAVSILCCRQGATFPPAREAHVSQWAAISQNPCTACRHAPHAGVCQRNQAWQHRMAWREVSLVQHGSNNLCPASLAGTQQQIVLLDGINVERVVQFSGAMGRFNLSAMIWRVMVLDRGSIGADRMGSWAHDIIGKSQMDRHVVCDMQATIPILFRDDKEGSTTQTHFGRRDHANASGA